MKKIQIIFQDGKPMNMYINTGYYATEVANEMKERVYGQVELKEYLVSDDQLNSFISNLQEIII